MAVVALSSLAAGISSFRLLGISGVIWAAVGALIGWLVWAGLTATATAPTWRA